MPAMRARQILITALVMTAAACSSAESSAPFTANGSTSVAPASSRTGETASSSPVSSATTTSLPPPLPEAPPAIGSPGSNKLLVLGDSVILGAKNTIPAALKGWDVTFDARESRFISDGLNVLKAHKSDYDKLKGLAYADLEQAYKDAGMAPPKPDPPASVIDVLGRQGSTLVIAHLELAVLHRDLVDARPAATAAAAGLGRVARAIRFDDRGHVVGRPTPHDEDRRLFQHQPRDLHVSLEERHHRDPCGHALHVDEGITALPVHAHAVEVHRAHAEPHGTELDADAVALRELRHFLPCDARTDAWDQRQPHQHEGKESDDDETKTQGPLA